ncbi:MAG: hypothetical protein GY851_02530, partial [bacterium]|nr:hypothetical protein [bacterium]
ENWSIAASGATKNVSTAGNASARPKISLTANGDLINPAIGDGERGIAFSGTVESGAVLEFDGDAQQVLLDGVDMTPYSQGEFPRVAPDGTTLTYTDDDASSHSASATVTFRDRWW